MSTRATCVVEGAHVTPCDGLDGVTEHALTSKGKGIHCWAFTNLATGKPSRTFYGVRSGDHVKPGIAFNFCPFCGTRIDGPLLEPKAPE